MNDRAFLFFAGLHQPSDAKHFDRCCVSIHRLVTRRKALLCASVFVDSGAFTVLEKHGCYPEPPEVYAGQLYRLHVEGGVNIAVASAQDYMCEPFMLAKTGLSVAEHQRLTIERYDAILAELTRLFGGEPPFPLMPVLQGFEIGEYLSHLEQWGDRLKPGMWVGVGSVCKRQGDIRVIETLLLCLRFYRPDLRFHGFGVKLSALKSPLVRFLLHSADSMAWSFSAAAQAGLLVRRLSQAVGRRVKPRVARRWYRRRGVRVPDPNNWREAKAFEARIYGLSSPQTGALSHAAH